MQATGREDAMKTGQEVFTGELRDYIREAIDGAFDAEGFSDTTMDCASGVNDGFSFAIIRPSTSEVFRVTVEPARLVAGGS